MLTRRATRVRGLREAREAAALSLPLLGPLPGDLVKLILRLLPLDERLRAREVRRGWCALLEDASFWTRVDLSKSCRVKSCRVNPNPCYGEERVVKSLYALALLRAASVRAKGNLQSLDLSGVGFIAGKPFVLRWLDSASAADKASLRDLVAPTSYRPNQIHDSTHTGTLKFFFWLDAEQVTAVCRALPLCRVRCMVRCSPVEALPLLRREPPFALLTIGQLYVVQNQGGDTVQSVLDLASALAGYKGMEKLRMIEVQLATRAVVDALVDSGISAGIKDMRFHYCCLSQTALPALTRLLQSPGFERLSLHNNNLTLFEGPALPAFFDALRNCKSLKTLRLFKVNIWEDVAVATQLIAALEGLPALQELALGADCWGFNEHRTAGECLARLIACSTSLRILDMYRNGLGEPGLALILTAIHSNSSLADLALDGEQISAKFALDVVLPAVHASTSLRKLSGLVSDDTGPLGAEQDPSMREVHDILEARRLADEDTLLFCAQCGAACGARKQ